MSIPLITIKKTVAILASAFKEKKSNARQLVATMVKFSEIARRDGILALENAVEEIDNEFLKGGIQMAIDGTDPDVISGTLSSELEQMQNRHENGKAIFELLGKYAPAYGMIGTLVGLILMLAELDDPASIAPNMAVALITTFYGALVANVLLCRWRISSTRKINRSRSPRRSSYRASWGFSRATVRACSSKSSTYSFHPTFAAERDREMARP